MGYTPPLFASPMMSALVSGMGLSAAGEVVKEPLIVVPTFQRSAALFILSHLLTPPSAAHQ